MKGKIKEIYRDKYISLLGVYSDYYEYIEESYIIIEAVAEDINRKKEVFNN